MWQNLLNEEMLNEAIRLSFEKDIIIFKHSTSCSISYSAKLRFEDKWNLDFISAYLLDLKMFRNLSDRISQIFEVHHESPQLLLIRNGECIYDASHFDISVEELNETLAYHAK
jgi:bacillithiol system protein YtxJ